MAQETRGTGGTALADQVDLTEEATGDKVSDYMTRKPETIDAHQALNTAASIMRDVDVGLLVVMDQERIHGVLTDRDIVVRALAEGRDPAETEVGTVCSTELYTVSPDSSIEEALELMSEKAVKRIVVAEDSKPVGVLSLADVAHLERVGQVVDDITDAPPND